MEIFIFLSKLFTMNFSSKIPRFPSEFPKTHAVFHNRDIMSIIGKYCVYGDVDRRTFVSVCRLWRQVYYARLTESEKRQSLCIFLMKNFCLDAFLLVFPSSSMKVDCFTSQILVESSLTRQNPLSDVIVFLHHLSRDKICPCTKLLMASAIMDETRFLGEMENKHKADDASVIIVNCAYLMTLIGQRPNITRHFINQLNQEQVDAIYSTLSAHVPRYANRLFDHSKASPQHMMIFSSFVKNNLTFESEFESLCRIMLRDMTVDQYVRSFFDADSTFIYKTHYQDIFLRVGTELEKFVDELFAPQRHYLQVRLVERFILLGLVDNCSTVRRKMVLISIPKMTIFEYACYSGNETMMEMIKSSPEFRIDDHIGVLVFMIKHKPRKAANLADSLDLDENEIDLAIQTVSDASGVTKKKDSTCFDEVISVLEKKKSSTARKRIKLDVT